MFKQLLDKLDKFQLNINEYLSEYHLNDEKLIESNKEAMIFNEKTELEIENLRDVIFNESYLNFEPKRSKVIYMDSLILSESKKVKELKVLCKFSSNQKWN